MIGSEPSIWMQAAYYLVVFLVVLPLSTFVVGRAGWMGKPRNWDRATYWTAFIVSMAASMGLIVYAQRMQADVRTRLYLVQLALFGLGMLLFGVAGGCLIGIFAYRRGKGPTWQTVTSPDAQRASSGEPNRGDSKENSD